MPISIYACGNKSHSCKKEALSNTEKPQNKDCCGNSKSSKNRGCAGKCGHSKCGCSSGSSSCFSTNLTIEILSPNNNLNFFTNQRNCFSDYSIAISDGFYSIWLIPKIG